MTIRFTCDQCGSVLKIKDELAGKHGKCPKCKVEFVVPAAQPSAQVVAAEPPAVAVPPAATQSPTVAEPPSAVGTPVETPARVDGSSSESTTDAAVISGPQSSEHPVSLPETMADRELDSPPVLVLEAPKATFKRKSVEDKSFDPLAFLMEGGPEARRVPTPFPQDDTPIRDSMGDGTGRPKSRGLRSPERSDTPASTSNFDGSIPDSLSHSDAAKLMIQAARASRDQTARTSGGDGKLGIDFAGMLEVGLKGLGLVLVGIVFAVGIYLVVDRMMGGNLKLPPLGYVTGTVTLDEKPLPGTIVYFAPQKHEFVNSKKAQARTSMGVADDQGRYKMIYIDKIAGVAVGDCRVWLELTGPDGRPIIPPDHSEVSLTVRKVEPGSQKFDFELKSGK